MKEIETKIRSGVRLDRQDGLTLMTCNDVAWLGYLANLAKLRISGDYVYFNINRHINLTNICTSKCKFCAFGCDDTSPQAYALTKEHVLSIACQSAQDERLRELHIVSGLHPDWPFEYYVDIIQSLHTALPHIHLKAFTGVEICHFAKIANLPIAQVLTTLKSAGLGSMPGGGAEILNDRVRHEVCPNKAGADEWLEVARTAHQLGIRTNASMLYGHIETGAERIDHLLTLRGLQDETGGFQSFIGLPFHPDNTCLQNRASRVSPWEDLKMVAISRLMLDNFNHIKAYWIMLTVPVAQLAIGFGANDIDGTVSEERISHAAGAKSDQELSVATMLKLIYQTGRIPVERDSLYNILNIYK